MISENTKKTISLVLIVLFFLTGILLAFRVGASKKCVKVKAKYTVQPEKSSTNFYIVDASDEVYYVKGDEYAIANVGDTACFLAY